MSMPRPESGPPESKLFGQKHVPIRTCVSMSGIARESAV
jgi:hypothetical protein